MDNSESLTLDSYVELLYPSKHSHIVFIGFGSTQVVLAAQFEAILFR